MTEPSAFSPIRSFDSALAATTSGAQLDEIRKQAPRFRDWFQATGTPDYVGTFDLARVPYPTRFGLFRASRSLAPFVTMTNRLLVIRFRDTQGTLRTLLWEPSDVTLGRNCAFYAELSRKAPSFLEPLAYREGRSVVQHLTQIGIRPEDVDYLSFDHLHIQDIRRLLGTTKPQPDLSPKAPIPPLFPRARLIVQRRELELLRHLHPLQAPWYQAHTFADLPKSAMLPIEGDVLLGRGVALLATPGHTPGNHTLVLNTASGTWASSENVIATECLTPQHSQMPGLRSYSHRSGLEVVLNGNTIETTAEQYNSIIKEKLIVDPSRDDPRFLQFFPSAELSYNWLNPGANPTFTHGQIAHGRLDTQPATGKVAA